MKLTFIYLYLGKQIHRLQIERKSVLLTTFMAISSSHNLSRNIPALFMRMSTFPKTFTVSENTPEKKQCKQLKSVNLMI